MKNGNLLGVLLITLSTTALANPDVIAGFKGFRAMYQEDHGGSNAQTGITEFTLGQSGEAAMLPVFTPEMTPGVVQTRQLDLKGFGTMFMIGEDEFSREWLSQNSVELASLHAIGLVVNVTHLPSLQALRELAPDIQLVPVAASELSQRLQIRHYPVLISDRVMTQKVDELKTGESE
ncbi:integrating conjugative element protein [Rouxiella badensis]|uniref:integrating conjugative element protein n=1 Tax=Rouxiella badensis TaxID=1646377 RepID=UPI001D15B1FF|nr:integrating conjugative element protein [Rouxiella badensis]MCC3701657.1 integrating conjugative element protein [Rouxiella badensis]